MMFSCNIGGVERAVRVIAGLGILSLAVVGPQTPWGYAGLVLVITGLVSWCPIWRVFGVNTCKLK
jgi:hypothetical protein